MKPLTLEMTAFMSYAAHTTIDFTLFHNKQVLIAGDTGAGKTTIFDAMTFALFGRASGTVREPKDFHCDRVGKEVDTLVRLSFEEAGKVYTVTRTIHYPKGRSGFGEPKLDATLEFSSIELGSASEVITGASRVTDRCCEIIGLNHEQFSKIVMLPQNDFVKFLHANSKERGEIFSKIFDNSEYVYYSNLIDGARKTLKERRDDDSRRLGSLMNQTFLQPTSDKVSQNPSLSGDEIPDAGRFLPNNPQLIDNLRALIDSEAQLLGELIDRRDQILQEGNKQTAAIKIAESFNRTMDDLDRARKSIEEQSAELEAARSAVQQDEAAKPELEDLKARITSLNEEIKLYTEVEGLERKLNAEEKKASGYSDEKTEAETKLATLATQAEQNRRRIKELANIEAVLAELNAKRDQAKSYCDTFAGVEAAIDEIHEDEKTREHESRELIRLTESAAALNTQHSRLYQAFIGGQASIMSGELHRRLAEAGEATCPVCGTHFANGQHPLLHASITTTDASDAPLKTSEVTLITEQESVIPTQADVEQSKSEFDAAEAARSEKRTSVERLAAGIEASKKSAILRAMDIPGVTAEVPTNTSWTHQSSLTWDELSKSEILEDIRNKLSSNWKALDAQASDAKSKQDEKKSLETKLEDAEEAKKTLESEIKEYEKLIKVAEAEAGKYDALIKEKRKSLTCTNLQAAESEAGKLEAKRDEITNAMESNAKTLARTKETFDTLQGSISAKEAQRKAIEAELKTSGIEISQDNRVNLTKMKAERDDLRARWNEANDECTSMEIRLQNHRDVSSKAKEITSSLAKTDEPYKLISTLADQAVGSSGEGGKLSYERYVMGAFFREVLEAANQRISYLSGGRYELVHKIEGNRANAAAGLEIEVLDHTTGVARSSNSLSGGEQFFTSFSLALGLSDVIRNHAGGVQIDALFIDEGFGSLSDEVLERALEVLSNLASDGRMVGIISHVDKLEESIPQKIRVKSTDRGSEVTIIAE